MTRIASNSALLCLCLAAGAAHAGIAVMRAEVSSDGSLWSDDLTVSPGAKVFIRLTASFSGPESVYGFSHGNMQPTIQNWELGDSVEPYLRTGNMASGSYAQNKPGPGEHAFGRIYPLAGPAQNPATNNNQTLGEHIQTINGSRYLRIAQNRATNWVGVGPTSGTAAVNNFNGGGGILFSQVAPASPGADAIRRSYATQDIVLFKFMITLDSAVTNRTLRVDLPEEGFSRAAGFRHVAWYTSVPHFPTSTLFTPVEPHASMIHVLGPVPAPAAAGLFAAWSLTLLRRRRN